MLAIRYLFLEKLPPYEPDDRNELMRASGKLMLLHTLLPKLQASGGCTPPAHAMMQLQADAAPNMTHSCI